MGGSIGPLLCTIDTKAEIEAANGLQQLEHIADLVMVRKIKDLRETHILDLHRLAVEGIYPCAGRYRDARVLVGIEGSDHAVAPAAFVPAFVQEAVTHVNDARESGAGCALERAAYAMWRLNWIHPFCGGNGRTARAVAYLILCLDMGSMLPGVPTVPALIYRRRAEYIDALREADAGEKQTGTPDLAKLTNFLREVVTTQLASALTRLSFGGSAPAG